MRSTPLLFACASELTDIRCDLSQSSLLACRRPSQKVYLDKTLSAFARSPPQGAHGPTAEESAWKNTWSWNLTDSTFGQLLLDVEDGRVSSEMRSQGSSWRILWQSQRG